MGGLNAPFSRSVPVTVVIAARNEAANVAACVQSVQWAAEVLVVEDGSTDQTSQIAASQGARIVTNTFTTIGAQRNAAIAQAVHDWVLVLDADERAPLDLATEIQRVVGATAPAVRAWRISRRNYFFGREIRHGGWERDRPVRLFTRDHRYSDDPVHEHVVTSGAPGDLRARLTHTPYVSLDAYFEKLGRYSRDWAQQHFARGRRASPLHVLVKPPARFMSMYVARGGWMDGGHGLILAMLAATSVAAKYAHLWSLTRQTRRGERTGIGAAS